MTCLTEEQVLAAIDGGVAPNDLVAIDAHLAGCATCRALRLELEELVDDVGAGPHLDEDAHVARVMARLEGPRARSSARQRSTMPRWMIGSGVATALALAATIFVVVRGDHGGTNEFTARGAHRASTVSRATSAFGSSAPVPITRSCRSSQTHPLHQARHSRAPTPICWPLRRISLLFAVDSAGDVHWLYPAYITAHDDPPSAMLAPSRTEVPMPTSVVLEAPAAGALRFVSVVTSAPLHVHDIEDRRAEALSHAALERAFPGASIQEVRVQLVVKETK